VGKIAKEQSEGVRFC